MGYKYTTQDLSREEIKELLKGATDAISEANDANKMAAIGYAYFAIISIPLGPAGLAITAVSTAEAIMAYINDDAIDICNNFINTLNNALVYMYENGIENMPFSLCTKSCTHPGTDEVLWYPYSIYAKGMPR